MLCLNCQRELVQKRFSSGVLESPSMLKRRKYCDRLCMAAHMTGQIRVMNPKNSRRQSGRMVKERCEVCSKHRGLHVHHKDYDPLNNDPSNLMTLCSSCHRRAHSPNWTEEGATPAPCRYCVKPAYKDGMCATHLSRWRRHGHPLAKKRKVGNDWILMLHDGQSWTSFRCLTKTPIGLIESEVTAMQLCPSLPLSS